MSAVTWDKCCTLNPNYPSCMLFSQVLEFTLDCDVTEVNGVLRPPIRFSGTAQIGFISPKKCRPFSIITAAVMFHYHIMVRGRLYEWNFQTRRKFVIASFFISLFVFYGGSAREGGEEGKRVGAPHPEAQPSLPRPFPGLLSFIRSGGRASDQTRKLKDNLTVNNILLCGRNPPREGVPGGSLLRGAAVAGEQPRGDNVLEVTSRIVILVFTFKPANPHLFCREVSLGYQRVSCRNKLSTHLNPEELPPACSLQVTAGIRVK